MERAFASEFPNDNEELHLGAIWRNDEPCGCARAVLPVIEEEPVAAEHEALAEEPIEIVDSIEIEDPIEIVPAPLESEIVLSSRAAEAFVDAMEIPPPPPVPVIEEPAAPPSDPWGAFVGVLVDGAIACGSPVAAAAIETALASDPIAAAWRAILRNESEDFSLCATTLDEWAGNTLAAIVGAPQKAAQLRRELRARGVAAFGLVLEAA